MLIGMPIAVFYMIGNKENQLYISRAVPKFDLEANLLQLVEACS